MPRVDIQALEAIARNELEQRDEERIICATKELAALREEVMARRKFSRFTQNGSLPGLEQTYYAERERVASCRRATDEVWK